ncbi:MAG: hypothetical protein AUH43_02160 [Acidobacteria bacterium 13_1_40CM_65_14]|nr:MAG: hypothetical protein AUH43_02160 [Acidobacteria bacterium 13_1_40CM_65_14]
MRIIAILLFVAAQAGSPSPHEAKTMSELMIDPIYPTSDAIFYISTRTPANDADWRALEAKTSALADAAKALAGPMYFRDRTRWMADAKLMIDASAAASDAAKRRDVNALVELNDALYTSCVQCHQDYRPNYGRRSLPAVADTPAAAAAAQPSPSASVRSPSPPASVGKPDLEGVWSFATITPLERPAEFAGKPELTADEAAAYERRTVEANNRDRRDKSSPEADVGGAYNEAWFDRGSVLTVVNGRKRTSLIVDPADGKIPALTPSGKQRADVRAADRRDHPTDGPENQGLPTRCLLFGAGPPIVPGPYNNFVQIFQFPDHVIILNEMIHDARIVPLDGRPHTAQAIRKWLGDSRGRWEGDTLVVDTTNFTDKTNFRGADGNLHVVERFTRTGPGTLLYEFTIDNPTAFTKPWSTAIGMTKSDDRIFEYACHEANYAMTGILRGARAEERGKP